MTPTATRSPTSLPAGTGFRRSSTTSAADRSPPELTGATVASSGVAIDLAFDEDLDLPATIPAALKDAFSVTAAGDTVEISGLAADGSSGLQIALSSRILKNQAVVVSYDQSAAGTNALDDAAGNEVVDFTTGASGVPAVVNNSTEVTPPTLSSAEVAAGFSNVISLNFSENLHGLPFILPASIAAAFTVTVDGVEVGFNSIAYSNKTLQITTAATIYRGQTVVVSYDKSVAGGDAIADSDGHEVDSFTTGEDGVPEVVNNSTTQLSADAAR